MEAPKTYKIVTMHDLAAIVTEQNVHDLATDIYQWLAFVAICKTRGIDTSSVGSLEWIDDGKNELTVTVAGLDGIPVGNVVYSAEKK